MPSRVQSLTHDRKEARELRKHQRLVSFVKHFADLRQQHVELRAWLVLSGFVYQARMTGRLSQPQQSLEDLDLRLLDALTFNQPKQ